MRIHGLIALVALLFAAPLALAEADALPKGRDFGAGVHMAMESTPATCAGMAFISTELGYAALPPGT